MAQVSVVSVNEENLKFFLPIISEEEQEAFRQGGRQGLGAVRDGMACGVLLFQYDGASIQIQYLAVSDSERRKGIGTILVDRLCRLADRDATPIFLDFFVEGDAEEDERVDFFESLYCFSCSRDSDGDHGNAYYVSVDQLKNSVLKQHAGRERTGLSKFYDRSTYKQRAILKKVGVSTAIIGEADTAVRQLCCFIGKEEDPLAAVFFQYDANPGVFQLTYLWAQRGKDAVLLRLLALVYDIMFEGGAASIPEIKGIRMTAVRQEAERMIAYLFPKKKQMGTCFSAVWDIGDFPLPQNSYLESEIESKDM